MIGAVVSGQDSGLRLAELVAAFSLATDLGMGQPMEHVLRSWLIAVRLGERLDIEAEARVALYYVMLLAWVGSVADTAEVATWFGDDIAFRGDSYRVDLAGLPMMGFALTHAGAGTPFAHRLRLAATLIVTGGRAVERGLMSHCLTTAQMAGRLGLASEVCDPLRQVFTRWDAKGVPEGVGGRRSHIRCGCFISPTPSRCSIGRVASMPRSRWLGPGAASTSNPRWWTCSAGRRPMCSPTWTPWPSSGR